MTMPHERLRRLGWGRDTLADIAADVLVPEPLRRQATWLYSIYPDTSQILQLVRSGAPALPDQWVSAFADALKLLRSTPPFVTDWNVAHAKCFLLATAGAAISKDLWRSGCRPD